MSKAHIISKVIIDERVKDMDIPFVVITKSGKFLNLTTSPDLLFKSLETADKKMGLVKSDLKGWRRIALASGVAVGYLAYKNYCLKRDVEKCKEINEKTLKNQYSEWDEEKSPTDI